MSRKQQQQQQQNARKTILFNNDVFPIRWIKLTKSDLTERGTCCSSIEFSYLVFFFFTLQLLRKTNEKRRDREE